MNKKKIIFIILPVLAVLFAVLAVVFLSGRNTVKDDGKYPFTAKTNGNSVTVKISSGDGWEAVDTGLETADIKQKSDRVFRVEIKEESAGVISFAKPEPDGTYYRIGVEFSMDENGKLRLPGADHAVTKTERAFAEDTALPFTVRYAGDGSAALCYTKNTEGIWTYETESDILSVSGAVTDADGTHFTVYALREGEAEVTFVNRIAGAASAVRFTAGADLQLTVTDAETVSREKQKTDKRDGGVKEESEDEVFDEEETE